MEMANVEFFSAYQTSILVLGFTGFLICLQLAIMDVASIKAKHIPGYAIEQSHGSFLFRASRAFANTNETVGILILVVLFAMFSGADAAWVNISALVYFAGRVAHMVFYYLNQKILRSVAFALSYVALLSIFCAGLWVWL